jgi:hypothetical protein
VAPVKRQNLVRHGEGKVRPKGGFEAGFRRAIVSFGADIYTGRQFRVDCYDISAPQRIYIHRPAIPAGTSCEIAGLILETRM